MIKLYWHSWACSTALHMMLELLKADYEYIDVEMHSPELCKINKTGAVPALIDTEVEWTNFTQLIAIAKYLLRKYPNSNLWSNLNSLDEFKLDQALTMLSSDIHKSFSSTFWPSSFTISKDENAILDVKNAWINKIEKSVEYLDWLLEQKNYLVLNKLTPADLYAHVMISWAEGFLWDKINNYKNIIAFQKRLREVPEIKKIWELYKSY